MGYWLQSYDIENVHFLIVDPSEHMAQLLVSMLRILGVRRITAARDGGSALEMISANAPDIVLTEIAMEPMDGFELMSRIRNSREGISSTLPIIVVSAYTESGFVQRARDSGMDEFLGKPVSVKMLYRKIVAVIESRRDFVKVSRYFGPDRRRHHGNVLPQMHRRKTDTGSSAVKYD